MVCCRKTYIFVCRWFYLALMFLGIILSCVAVASCKFVTIEYEEDVDTPVTGPDGNAYTEVGLYRHHDAAEDMCVPHYEDLSFDSSEEGARMGGVVAPMCAAVAFFFILLEPCCACRSCCCGRYLIMFLLVLAQIFQGLTFLWFNSAFCGGDLVREVTQQKPCTVSEGAAASVAALVLYFVAGIALHFVPLPMKENESTKADDSFTTTKSESDEDSVKEDAGTMA